MKIDSEFEKIFEDFLEEYFYRFSVDATKLGLHRYDYKLSNLRKSDLDDWKNELNDFRGKIQTFKNIKFPVKNTDFFLFEKKIIEELDAVSGESEYFTSPLPYVSNIFDGLICPAFGSYASLGVRGKSFTERLNDVSNTRKAVEENLKLSNNLGKKAAKDQLDILKLLISEFTGYLLTKSDIEKKDDIKQAKNTFLENLDAIAACIDNLYLDLDTEHGFLKSFRNMYPEMVNALKGAEVSIKESLLKTADLIVKKAREIKISAPFLETLKNVLDEKILISQEQLDSVFQSIKDAGKEMFGETDLKINFRKLVLSEENTQKLSRISHPFEILACGVFDRNLYVSFTSFAPVSIPFLVSNLVRYVYPGKAYLTEVKKNKEKQYRKYFGNKMIEEGWKVYAVQGMKDSLKRIFGNGFELSSLYGEYLYLLKALIQCKLLNHEIATPEIERIVSEDQVLLDKDMFLKEFILDEGQSLLGFLGFNTILDLKRQFVRKYQERDFNLNLLSNSSLPIRTMRQVL